MLLEEQNLTVEGKEVNPLITLEAFMCCLFLSSSVTALMTEAIKKLMAENKFKFGTNTLTAIVAVIVASAIGIGHIILSNIPFTSSVIVYLIGQIVASWLCAMVGYDKVIQAIGQIKTKGKDE